MDWVQVTSTVTLSNVTANGSSVGLYARGNGTYNIVGGTYTGNTNALNTNSENAKITLDGATLTTTGNSAIYVGSYSRGSLGGKINIINNTYVKGTKNGIYFDYGGTVILGQKGASVSDSSPIIVGGDYAINFARNTGEYEFYDGILKGKTASYRYLPDIIEPGYRLKDGEEIIEGETYQTATIEKQDGFLQVGSDIYDDLETAVQAIDGTGTIDVIADGEIVYPTTIQSSQNITIDLHGYTLGSISTITNNGTLTLKDSSNDESGIIYSRNNTFVDNNNNLTIKSGSYISDNNNSNFLYQNKSTATMTIDGGTLNVETTSSSINTIYIKTGTLTINGGNISNSYATPIACYGNMTINDFNNTIITSPSTSISLMGTTTVINGGTINGTISNSSNLTINGGTITATKNNTNGITNSGTLIITGGYIKGKSYGISTSTKKLVIGVDDSSVTIATPVIEGETYGVSSSTTNNIEFYDGIIKGKTGRFQYIPKTIASGTNLANDTETLENDTILLTAYLAQEKDFLQNYNNNEVYSNINTAISEASSGDKLVLIDDGVSFELVNVDKDLTIDLNNHTFSTSRKIINSNTLNIIDDSQDKNGKIITGSSIDLIDNSGTLNVRDVEIINNSSLTTNYTIINTGTLDTANTSINSSCRAINNSGDFISDTTIISAKSYSVYNNKDIDITDSDYHSTNSSCIYSDRNNVNIRINGGTYKGEGNASSAIDVNSSGSIGTSTLNVEDASFSGSYHSIASSIPTTINRCNLNSRLFINSNSGSSSISNSTVGRISNSGNLTVNNVTTTRNNTDNDTGVVYNEGNIDITDLTMTTNSLIAIYNK